MRIILYIIPLSLSLFGGCNNKPSKSTKIHNKDFDWKIEIPRGFESVSAAQWAKMQNKGADAIEKTYGAEVENRATTLFVFKSDQFNYFESNYQPFDTTLDGDYIESVRSVNEMLYTTFDSQMPDAKLDSVWSEETIDGKVFQTFKLEIKMPNGMTMESLSYSRLFGNKEFSVNIMTVNREKKEALLDAWRHATFGAK